MSQPTASEPATYALVDAANLCFAHTDKSWPDIRRLDAALKYLVAELDEEIHPIIDASIEHQFKDKNENHYRRIKKKYKIRTAPAGTKADIHILEIADQVNGIVISNDKFTEYQSKYPWLINCDRHLSMMGIELGGTWTWSVTTMYKKEKNGQPKETQAEVDEGQKATSDLLDYIHRLLAEQGGASNLGTIAGQCGVEGGFKERYGARLSDLLESDQRFIVEKHSSGTTCRINAPETVASPAIGEGAPSLGQIQETIRTALQPGPRRMAEVANEATVEGGYKAAFGTTFAVLLKGMSDIERYEVDNVQWLRLRSEDDQAALSPASRPTCETRDSYEVFWSLVTDDQTADAVEYLWSSDETQLHNACSWGAATVLAAMAVSPVDWVAFYRIFPEHLLEGDAPPLHEEESIHAGIKVLDETFEESMCRAMLGVMEESTKAPAHVTARLLSVFAIKIGSILQSYPSSVTSVESIVQDIYGSFKSSYPDADAFLLGQLSPS